MSITIGMQTSERTARRVAWRYLSAMDDGFGGHELLVGADVLDEVAMLGRCLVERLRLDPAMRVAEIIEAVDDIVGVAQEADRLIPF